MLHHPGGLLPASILSLKESDERSYKNRKVLTRPHLCGNGLYLCLRTSGEKASPSASLP